VSQALKFMKQLILPKEELLSDLKKKLLSEETYSYD
jgi:hypothetical protein